MRADDVIVNYGLLVLIQFYTVLFSNGSKHFVLVLCQEAEPLVQIVHRFLVLFFNFLLFNLLFFFLLTLEEFVALLFGSLILLLHLFILCLKLLRLRLFVHILLQLLIFFLITFFDLHFLFFLFGLLMIDHFLKICNSGEWNWRREEVKQRADHRNAKE